MRPSGSRVLQPLLAGSFLLLALPSFAFASSLVWGDPNGGTPVQIEITDGGTYAVPFNIPAPGHVNFSPDIQDIVVANLYRVDDVSDPSDPSYEFIANVFHPDFDPEVVFAWPSAGSYVVEINFLPVLSFQERVKNFIARLLFAEVAYAQFDGPIETIHFTIEETGPTTFTPVLIIPGILGSAQHNGEWLIDPITHAYDNLIDTLAANGYEHEMTLFPFPYDWHKSNIDTAVLLNAKIDEVKSTCGCDKVDIVAHSMGGLVARYYIQSSFYDDDVRKLIFLGTPHLGAPKAYLMWEGGESDIDKSGQQLKFFLLTEAVKHGFLNLFDYIRAIPIPSVHELLPVYGYIKHVGSLDIPSFPNSEWYPDNFFLSDLNNKTIDLYSSGVTISNFVGHLADNTTITAIRVIPPPAINPVVLWGFGVPEGFLSNSGDRGLERGDGDGTVPLSSASLVISGIHTIDSEHNKLPTKAEGDVFEKLTGSIASTLVTGQDKLDIPMLIFQILSPADIVVVDPDGFRVGKDFLTGQELHEIPDAFYSGYGTDDEYVTIPDPKNGEYKVLTQGTGSGGAYTIATAVIGDATSSDAFFTGTTLPNLITEHDVNVDPANPEATTIVPADQTPPTITFVQPATTTYTHDAMLPIKVTFADDTGIASSSALFDTTTVAASSTMDLFFQTLGNHTITAYAEDLVNNAATSSRTIQVIATVSSTISDINRAFTLGWIKSKDAKNFLINTLTKASKLKKQSDRIAVYKLMLEAIKFGRNIGVITPQGYQLLTADINWLINH